MNNCRSGYRSIVRFLVYDAHCPVDATDEDGKHCNVMSFMHGSSHVHVIQKVHMYMHMRQL